MAEVFRVSWKFVLSGGRGLLSGIFIVLVDLADFIL